MFGKKKTQPQAAPPSITLYLTEDEGDFEARDGHKIHAEGMDVYADPERTREIDIDQEAPALPGVFHCKIVGVTRHAAVLQTPELDLWAQVLVRPEPSNPVDPNALAVITPSGKPVGYLPAELAAALSGQLPPHSLGQALVTNTWTDGGQRTGVAILGTVGRSFGATTE